MPITLSLESFGAKTELSRAEFGMEGTIEKAEELLAKNPDYFLRNALPK